MEMDGHFEINARDIMRGLLWQPHSVMDSQHALRHGSHPYMNIAN